jgi:type I restriction enzyme S subunit
VLTPQTTYYRCQPEALDASYLVYLFASPQFYSQLANVMSQTTRDFVPISEQYLLYFLVPPPAEQREIVRRVSALFALADRIEDRLTDARRMADQLTQAVLAKAFRGELVPTEAELARREKRTYEHAADLLARIRSEREAATMPGDGTKQRPRLTKQSRQKS